MQLFESQITIVADEYGLDAPWSQTSLPDEKLLKLMPPFFSREQMYSEVCSSLSDSDILSRSTFYTTLKKDKFSYIRFSKKEKGLCDQCINLRESTRELQTKHDSVSIARRLCLERKLSIHVLRQRMSRHLYRECQSKV